MSALGRKASFIHLLIKHWQFLVIADEETQIREAGLTLGHQTGAHETDCIFPLYQACKTGQHHCPPGSTDVAEACTLFWTRVQTKGHLEGGGRGPREGWPTCGRGKDISKRRLKKQMLMK